jgi:hypothetical protein
LSRILDSEKLAERKVWEDLYSVRPDNSKEASIDDTSLLTVLIRSFEHMDFAVAPVLSSALNFDKK